MSSHRRALAALVCVALFGAGSVVAQNAPAQDEHVGLQEVIVSAQKRDEDLQKAPLAVTVIDREALQRAGVTTPNQLVKLASGLNIAQVGSNTQFFINGVGSGIVNAYGDPAIAFNVDGVYLARPTGTNGVFYDVERVEVLKGPQGTLYGRNATAGAINVVTRKPVFEDQRAFGLEFGNYDLLKADAMLNFGISEDVAARVAVQAVRRDGYYTDGYDDAQDVGGRAQLLWNIRDDVDLLLAADFFHQGGRGVGTVPFNLPIGKFVDPSNPWLGPSSDRINAYVASLQPTAPANNRFQADDRGFQDNRNVGARAELTWDTRLGTWSTIAAWRDTKQDASSFLNGFESIVDLQATQRSLETRLASRSGDRLSWLLGLYYFYETNESTNITNRFFQGVTTLRLDPLTTEQYAIFTQETFSLTDRLRLTGGLRYTSDKKEQTGTNTFPTRVTIPNDGAETWGATSWKAGLEFDAADSSLLYLSAGTGFKAGGFNIGQPPGNVYNQEKLTAYTLGSKNRFFNDRLQINAEVFYWDYIDRQVSILGPINPAPLTAAIFVNLGESHMQGVSLDLGFAATRNGLFTANLQYLEALNDDVKTPSANPAALGCPAANNPVTGALLADCSGKPTPQAPEWSGNVGYRHSFPFSPGGKLTIGASTHFETSSYFTISYLPTTRRGSYHLTDADMTYTPAGEQWSVGLFVRNIEDEPVIVSTGGASPVIGVPGGTLVAPRTYGIRMNARF